MRAARMSLGEVWGPLQTSQLDWAYRAYRRFTETLSGDVRQHFVLDDEHHDPKVVVFGRTQVGKTTLLLDLMGVTAEALPRVSNVLRGGRSTGNSATATTMEYRRSSDGLWRLDRGGGVQLVSDDKAMLDAMGRLRRDMSAQRLSGHEPVIVWIPDECFAEKNRIGIRMLDLPGDSPADDVERRHVESVAAHHLPRADLILLVGKADDLSFLSPAALTLPGIDDWQFIPNRFLIITTYSFTLASLQTFAREQKEVLTPLHFRTRLLEQMARSDLQVSPEASQPERYFPLEFGQSWQELSVMDSELVALVGPVLSQLKEALQACIAASASEASRFRNALDVHLLVRRKREALLRGRDEALRLHTRRKSETDAHRRDAIQKAGLAKQACKKMRALLEVCPQALQGLCQSINIDCKEMLSKVEQLDSNADAFLELIQEVRVWLHTKFQHMRPDRRECAGSGVSPHLIEAKTILGTARPSLVASRQQFEEILEGAFAGLASQIDGYMIKAYYPKISKQFSQDKASLHAAIRDATDEVTRLAQEKWAKTFELRVAEIEAGAGQHHAQRLQLLRVARERGRKRARIRREREVLEHDMQLALARLRHDADVAERFERMLAEEYLHELRRCRAMAEDVSAPVPALLALLSSQAMIDQYRKITLH